MGNPGPVTGRSRIVDLADIASWPEAVERLISEKADRLTANRAFKPRRQYAYDLSPDDELEDELKAALSDTEIRMYHATRLLPGELEAVRAEGLRSLSDELRRAKLDYALGWISEEERALLEGSGPLHWSDHPQPDRRGLLYVFGPFGPARYEWGLNPLLYTWGGESIYFGNDRDGPLSEVIARLTVASRPAFIEVGVRVQELNRWKNLWPSMVGGVLQCKKPWNEWHLRCDIPPERVLDVIQPGHPRWPKKRPVSSSRT
jgi:hypothetical protein